jgi:hypothetical protein
MRLMAKRTPLTLGELHALIPRIAATASMLEQLARQYAEGARAAATGGKRGRRAGTGGGKKRSRAAGSAIQDKLLAALTAGKGMQLGALVAKVGLDRGAVKYHLRALRAKKRARVVGDRRDARWYAA